MREEARTRIDGDKGREMRGSLKWRSTAREEESADAIELKYFTSESTSSMESEERLGCFRAPLPPPAPALHMTIAYICHAAAVTFIV